MIPASVPHTLTSRTSLRPPRDWSHGDEQCTHATYIRSVSFRLHLLPSYYCNYLLPTPQTKYERRQLEQAVNSSKANRLEPPLRQTRPARPDHRTPSASLGWALFPRTPSPNTSPRPAGKSLLARHSPVAGSCGFGPLRKFGIGLEQNPRLQEHTGSIRLGASRPPRGKGIAVVGIPPGQASLPPASRARRPSHMSS